MQLASVSLERLEQEITELAAHIHAATCRWLCLVAEFDRREGWAGWGARSCAEWIAFTCGVAPGAAREHARVARRLGELPKVCAAFAAGELSYSKVRAMTRVATADNEAEVVMLAQHATAAQLERVLRGYRGAASAALGTSNRAHAQRFLTWSWDDDGSLVLRGRLPPEDGALVVAALEAARAALDAEHAEQGSAETLEDPASDDGEGVPAETPADLATADEAASAQCRVERSTWDEGASAETSADPLAASRDRVAALTVMAETMLARGPAAAAGGERYQVVVHVDADTLRHEHSDGECALDDGPAIPPQTALRLACDSAVVPMLESGGRPLSVGRRTRSIPPAIRRALRRRDHGCRFPGCTQRRFVDAHHIDHWAHGGETKLSNLVLLCRHHHRLLHEGGYRLEHSRGGDVVFRRPDGHPLPVHPRPRRGDHDAPARANRDAGLTIRPDTCIPRSLGQTLDYGQAVDGLLARAGLVGAQLPAHEVGAVPLAPTGLRP